MKTILMVATRLAGIAVLVLTAPMAPAATITFSDQTFNDADWSAFELIDTTPGNTFVFTAGQILTGGNPGAHRHLTQNSTSAGPVAIATGHLFAGGIFDPGEDGTFASLDFGIDGISINSTAGAVGYGLLLVQNARFYTAIGFGPLNGTGWQTLNQSGFTGPEFFETFADGTFNANSDPDFSNAGAPIQVGFFTSNGTFGNSTNDGGADNWSVTIHTTVTAVPEPQAMWLLGSGLLGLAASRRRRA